MVILGFLKRIWLLFGVAPIIAIGVGMLLLFYILMKILKEKSPFLILLQKALNLCLLNKFYHIFYDKDTEIFALNF
jgi:hypothetical protein